MASSAFRMGAVGRSSRSVPRAASRWASIFTPIRLAAFAEDALWSSWSMCPNVGAYATCVDRWLPQFFNHWHFASFVVLTCMVRPVMSDGHFMVVMLTLFVGACSAGGPDLEPAIEGRFDIGGTKLYLQCVGTPGASPTVLLMHGIGTHASSSSWDHVMEQLAPSRFACRYDRAGTGKSDAPSEKDRTGKDLVSNLHALLKAAKVAGPFVLAGHSFGSYPARLYAAAHPGDITGILFVDALHEQIGLLDATGTADWDDVPQAQEQLDLEAVEEAVRQSSIPEMSIFVLSRGQGVSTEWERAQRALLTLSDRSRRRILEQSGHAVPQDDPSAVVSALDDLNTF